MGRSSKKGGSDAIKRVPLFRVSTQESLDSPIDRRSDFYRQKAIESGPVSPRLFTLPTILTILRILLVPVLVVLWFNPWKWAPFLGAQVFMFASLTDCLDGFLARKLNLTTAFGAFLDPVADKLMVSAALILLSIDPPQPMSSTAIAIPVIVIIGREITMSALREWAASASAEAHKYCFSPLLLDWIPGSEGQFTWKMENCISVFKFSNAAELQETRNVVDTH